ncbi:hypothetical protein [Janthinobacterium sp. B9-8]|uniref:hypothetical protein n=1 Tax=Janthinobacterium sp. B9-8 TaxID=1236179 RepID=UPI0012E3A3B7|nr:hypothetical protein [Janthinobacterium sp. B9-8]
MKDLNQKKVLPHPSVLFYSPDEERPEPEAWHVMRQTDESALAKKLARQQLRREVWEKISSRAVQLSLDADDLYEWVVEQAALKTQTQQQFPWSAF